MSKVLMVLLIALVLEAVGVVFLSRGLKPIGEPERVAVAEVLQVLRRGQVTGVGGRQNAAWTGGRARVGTGRRG